MPRDDYIDITGTLRKAQRQIESARTKTGLRSLRALEPDDLRLPERLRFFYLRGLAHLQRQDAARAMPDLDRALALAHQLHNGEAATRAANLAGWAHRQQGRPAMALEHHRRAFHAVQEGQVTDPEFQALVAADLAADYWALADYARAHEVYREAVRRFEGKASPATLATLAWGLAVTAFHLGDLQQARTYALRTVEIYEAEAAQTDPARKAAGQELLPRARINYTTILLALDSREEATRQLGAAATVPDDPPLQAAIHEHLAELALRRGLGEIAQAEASAGMEAARRSKDPRLVGRAHQQAAQVAAATGDLSAAGGRYRQALEVLEATPHRSLLGEVQFNYARLLQQQGRTEEAITVYEQAYRSAGTAPPPGHARLMPPPDQPGYTRQPATGGERRQSRSSQGEDETGPAANASEAAPPRRPGRRPRQSAAPAEPSVSVKAPARRGRRPRTPAPTP